MANTTYTIGSTGVKKPLVDVGSSTYADGVVDISGGYAATEIIPAKATGSTGGLGKIANLANTEAIYVRVDASDIPYGAVDWRIQCAKQHDVQLYKARSIVDSVTLTLASFVDTNTIVLNGLTYTGESTAGDVEWSKREFKCQGTDAADAAALAAIINADYSVVTAGTSVAGTDKLTITTDEGEFNIVAAAAADYPAGKYKLDATAATERASIVLAINHKDNVTCASVAVADTVTVGGITYTAAASEDTDAHEFAQITSNDATGTSLAACVNADTATHGITAANVSGVVSFTRGSESATVGLASSNATRLKTEAAGGVPGVIATANGTTAELSITPTWTSVLTVTETGDRLTVTDIDCPGVLAAAADAVVTLTPGTPAGTDGELATVIQATAAANCTVSQAATLLGLSIDGAANSNVAINNTTAGTLYTQDVKGWEYLYAGITADADAATVVVGATLRQ
ncbi:MAG: hypothetical protein PHS80_15355 [Methanothrix sp.]|nr:hypothetical protein [Methanothrix sp.]